jgi:hypothetical protein
MKEVKKPTKPTVTLDVDKLRELTPAQTSAVVGGGARCMASA